MLRKDPAIIPTRESPIRILLIRLGAIGDVLITSPVAQALRESFPAAHIAWLVEPPAAPLVRANPYVDEVILLERNAEWHRLLHEWRMLSCIRELRAFSRGLRERHFDITFDFHGNFSSGLLAWLSGAPRRIGFTPSVEYNHLFLTEREKLPLHPTRVTQASVSLLAALGVPTTPRRPVLNIPEEERRQAQEFLAAHGLSQHPYVACCISSAQPQKDWVWTRWGELADLLWEQEGLRTVFIGDPAHRVDSLHLVEGCTSSPISAVGRLPLMPSAALVQGAALTIGCDTGLTYAGLATNTPTVILYGPTDSTRLAEEPHTAVCFHPTTCSPCHRPKCKEYDCMKAITPREVLETAIMLLNHHPLPI